MTSGNASLLRAVLLAGLAICSFGAGAQAQQKPRCGNGPPAQMVKFCTEESDRKNLSGARRAQVLFHLGQAHHGLGDIDTAHAVFQSALKLVPRRSRQASLIELNIRLTDPTRADALLHASQFARQSGELERTRTLLDRALAADPRHANAYFARADLREARGDRDGALSDYLLAAEHYPRAKPDDRETVAFIRAKAEDIRRQQRNRAKIAEALTLDRLQLCRFSVNAKRTGWETDPNFAAYVDQARAVGLGVTDCVRIVTLEEREQREKVAGAARSLLADLEAYGQQFPDSPLALDILRAAVALSGVVQANGSPVELRGAHAALERAVAANPALAAYHAEWSKQREAKLRQEAAAHRATADLVGQFLRGHVARNLTDGRAAAQLALVDELGRAREDDPAAVLAGRQADAMARLREWALSDAFDAYRREACSRTPANAAC